ncbi:MAG: arsenosugar biosynthesis radical SAM protein ArsS [Planctomycetota bacterium]|nr:arsenosugar biosynthesis radical SAM protein ArsS [Planctomycetota bacterium]
MDTAAPPDQTAAKANAFDRAVYAECGVPLESESLRTVQLNIGLTCNLACLHCHVVSGPKRTEQMSRSTLEQVLRLAQDAGAELIDITGGAPEMNPDFRWFVTAARARGHGVMVRTNLTILLEAGYTDLPEFFHEHGVHLVASLPCYLPENVDRQRGRNVHENSMAAIRRLNALGYGADPGLPLDLVYNPVGAHLPPAQAGLERDYRRVLLGDYGIVFTRLIAITNMAIGRFVRDLDRQGKAEDYLELLRASFNPSTVPGLMCRHQIHVSYDGTLHDCDFNYALDLACTHQTADGARVRRSVVDADVATLRRRKIETGEHCFGCTAGAGSSCGGAIV